ncbi:MAG: Metallo-beta-lactamase superfamily 1 protein [Bacteroidetes bacterium]|nr:Metallo-beta-lactamase superfamily 1 protein [Bacteroidota bacterium]
MKNELSTCVLGSSSAGNSTIIWNAGTAILIDCGFSPAYIASQLRRLGLRISDLKGVFITHVHGDHVHESTVRRLIQERVPIFCPPQIEPHLQKKYSALARASHQGLLKVIKKSEVELSEFHIRPFEVPHDSDGGCFGYSISYDAEGRTKKVSVTTDMAYPTKSVVGHIADSDVIVIESNYDVEMLEESTRPVWLKRRIREEGHLSNDQCGESLLQIIDRSQTLPKSLALAHVSQECNTNELALECTKAALDRHGIHGISVFETHPDRPGRTITV